MSFLRSVVHRVFGVRRIPTRLEGIEQNLRELNEAMVRIDQRVDAVIEVEVPGLFLAAERSNAEAIARNAAARDAVCRSADQAAADLSVESAQ